MSTDPNSPYRYYYSQLYTKLKKGRLELFKTRRDQPDSEVTLDGICDELIIHGSPDKVADEILKFREQVGDFGTLLYAGKDWRDPKLAKRSMTLLAEKVLPKVNAAIKKAAKTSRDAGPASSSPSRSRRARWRGCARWPTSRSIRIPAACCRRTS